MSLEILFISRIYLLEMWGSCCGASCSSKRRKQSSNSQAIRGQGWEKSLCFRKKRRLEGEESALKKASFSQLRVAKL